MSAFSKTSPFKQQKPPTPTSKLPPPPPSNLSSPTPSVKPPPIPKTLTPSPPAVPTTSSIQTKSNPPLPDKTNRGGNQLTSIQTTNLPPAPKRTSSGSSLPPTPNLREARLRQLQESAEKWVSHRKHLIRSMDNMILNLNDVKEKGLMASVGGRTGSLVGLGMMTGGVVLAPFTLGASLLAVPAGLAVTGVGVGTSVGAVAYEWKNTRDSLKQIQGEMEKDVKYAEQVIQNATLLSNCDPDCDSRILNVNDFNVKAINFILGVSGNPHKTVEDKSGVSSSTIKSGAVFGAKVIVGFNPIIGVPLDLMLIADDMEQIEKKEPASLAAVMVPVSRDLKKQLKQATEEVAENE
ncbi:hypothetical protein AKO1_006503 [Acrasis kona]|uniref:Uncharacterized protein n=1 Tax=Acrasis kona TaxID=1008807 RepID=A0AAW2ZNI6_9EUKA